MKKLIAVLGVLLVASVAAAGGDSGKASVPTPPIKKPPVAKGSVEKKVPLADMTVKVISADASANTLTFVELPKKAKPGENAAGSAPDKPTEAAASNQTLPCEGGALEVLAKIRGGETVRLTIGDMKGEAGVMEGHKVITKIKLISAGDKKVESKAAHS